eukprot:5800477-Lingulodinium_polyedra.AAC.1
MRGGPRARLPRACGRGRPRGWRPALHGGRSLHLQLGGGLVGRGRGQRTRSWRRPLPGRLAAPMEE